MPIPMIGAIYGLDGGGFEFINNRTRQNIKVGSHGATLVLPATISGL